MYTIEQLEPHREILRFDPCDDAVDYLATQLDLKSAWENCTRGDWMAWVATQIGVSKRTIILAGSLYTKTAYHLMSEEAKKAVDFAEKYGRGQSTEEEFETTKKVACAAAISAGFLAYSNFDRFLADFAAVFSYAVYTADFTPVFAYTTKSAYFEAKSKGLDPEKAKEENLVKTADICREVLTKEVFEILNIEQ